MDQDTIEITLTVERDDYGRYLARDVELPGRTGRFDVLIEIA